MMLYATAANNLVERILELPHEDVLACTSPWDLFKLGLKCGDLDVSLGQASWALGAAKSRLQEAK